MAWAIFLSLFGYYLTCFTLFFVKNKAEEQREQRSRARNRTIRRYRDRWCRERKDLDRINWLQEGF